MAQNLGIPLDEKVYTNLISIYGKFGTLYNDIFYSSFKWFLYVLYVSFFLLFFSEFELDGDQTFGMSI